MSPEFVCLINFKKRINVGLPSLSAKLKNTNIYDKMAIQKASDKTADLIIVFTLFKSTDKALSALTVKSKKILHAIYFF
jgi:hypothetical protein